MNMSDEELIAELREVVEENYEPEPNRTPGWRVWVRPNMGSMQVIGGGIVTVRAKDRDEAIAAAQADYERRIMSALSPSPVGVTEQMLIDAFMQGASWRRRNGIPEGHEMIYEPKAARDYADATLSALSHHKPEGGAMGVEDFPIQKLVTELVRECERAISQRDRALADPTQRGEDGRTHDTCFEVIVRNWLTTALASHEPAPGDNQDETVRPNISDVTAALGRRIPTSTEAEGEVVWEFDRYINGDLMAEGVTIEREPDLERAAAKAARIASRGPNGEAPVLVLRNPLSLLIQARKERDRATQYWKDAENNVAELMAHTNTRITELIDLMVFIRKQFVAWAAIRGRDGVYADVIDKIDAALGRQTDER